MKLVFFDDFKLGVIRDNQVVDVRGAVSGITHSSPQDLINKIIADFDKYRGDIQNAADSGSGISVDQVRLRSPMPKPGNIVCMAVNYMEDGTRSEPAPINAFHKSPNSVINHVSLYSLRKLRSIKVIWKVIILRKIVKLFIHLRKKNSDY